MKQAFFIFLVFISFQGFSQSVKLPEIGLEVMTKDLGEMNWYNAIKACDTLGDGWRLPSKDELLKIYKFKEKIGIFEKSLYWSSTPFGDGYPKFAWYVSFTSGGVESSNKDYAWYVRAVRTIK
jgi:hypothetical protein